MSWALAFTGLVEHMTPAAPMVWKEPKQIGICALEKVLENQKTVKYFNLPQPSSLFLTTTSFQS